MTDTGRRDTRAQSRWLLSCLPLSTIWLISSPLMIAAFGRRGEYSWPLSQAGLQLLALTLLWCLVAPRFVAGIMFLLALVQTADLLHFLHVGTHLNAYSLRAVLASNGPEMREFLSIFSRWYFWPLIFSYLLGFLLLLRHDLRYRTQRCVPRWLLLLSLPWLVLGYVDRGPWCLAPEYVRVLAQDQTLWAEPARLQRTEEIQAVSTLPATKQVYVVVIGESVNRHHLSIYGYQKETTPRLESLGKELLVFDNVIAPFSGTLDNVLGMLTPSDAANKASFLQDINLVQVMAVAGFKTYWISNQAPGGVKGNVADLVGVNSDECWLMNRSSDTSNAYPDSPFDEILLPPFRKALRDEGNKKFIIVHLMGSHVDYGKRYPETFNRFCEGPLGAREAVVCQYDNSISYTDFVVSELIATLKEQYGDQASALIFLSDHGEDVYDSGDYNAHMWPALQIPVADIPFVLWLSDGMREKRSAWVSKIEKYLSRPFMSDSLFHAVLDVASVESSHFVAGRSLFSSHFVPAKRLVYGQEYDALNLSLNGE